MNKKQVVIQRIEADWIRDFDSKTCREVMDYLMTLSPDNILVLDDYGNYGEELYGWISGVREETDKEYNARIKAEEKAAKAAEKLRAAEAKRDKNANKQNLEIVLKQLKDQYESIPEKIELIKAALERENKK